MHLFYDPDIKDHVSEFMLNESESLHFNVLRIAESEIVMLTNGQGLMCKAKLLWKTKRKVKLALYDCEQSQQKRRVHLVVAPLKNNDRFDFLLEKTTELGVTDIWPLYTHYTERKKINEGRVEKRLIAAVKQSFRAFKPRWHDMQSVDAFLKHIPLNTHCFIAHCKRDTLPLFSTQLTSIGTNDILLMIGPEGGFTEMEIQLALEADFQEVSLSKNRLRTETAAMVGVMMMKIGDSL